MSKVWIYLKKGLSLTFDREIFQAHLKLHCPEYKGFQIALLRSGIRIQNIQGIEKDKLRGKNSYVLWEIQEDFM